ncbi:hypothetical protein [uncultured Rikenella sp.]|uniref:carboxylesterase family protein n=1 Tax=uncultured Rikenella sp. TaxID=368003 RepID=UPI002610DA98|nr:hypothetical protein [uncultured Rikenella sp.]
MKSSLFLLGLIPMLTCGCSKADNPTPPPDDGEAKEAYVAYFTKSLGGDKTPYPTGAVLTADQVAEEQTAVWDSWKAANASLSEEKLATPTSMPAYTANPPAESGTWSLADANSAYSGKMPYYYFSKGSKPAAGYPLFIFLHGSGNDPVNEQYACFGWSTYFQDSPCLYFIPQSPKGGTGTRWKLKSRQAAWEKLLRLSFLSDADPNRVYFMGISEGAYGSQSLASFYADYLAGAGPMAGGENLKFAPPENYANIAFTLHTGDQDVAYSRDELTMAVNDELNELATTHPGYYNHNVALIPGAAHGFYYNEAQTTEWLKAQAARNPWPKYVYWENFPMDESYESATRYRDGFYNLYVKERSNDDASSRSCYEMTIDGNTVDLAVSTVTYAPDVVGSYGIPLTYTKTYTPATKGKVVIYLNDKLVDLDEPVTVRVNGREAFKGKVELNAAHLVNSCAAFFDPERLFPAAVEVQVQ